MPIGYGKSTAGLGGNVPQVNLTGMTRTVMTRLFFSRRESALLLGKTVRGGFGHLNAGTVMGAIAGDDRIVPFAAVGAASPLGKSFLVADAVNGNANITVSLSDSYRFQPGDPVVLYNSNAGGTYMRTTIVAAGITRGATTANIELTAAVDAATYTMANGVFLAHRTGADAADATSLAAAYVLDQDIYTGEGIETIQPDGALGSVVVSNAILYADVIENINANALTALGMVRDAGNDGRLYIMR